MELFSVIVEDKELCITVSFSKITPKSFSFLHIGMSKLQLPFNKTKMVSDFPHNIKYIKVWKEDKKSSTLGKTWSQEYSWSTLR